jgi:hypothetical protein
VGLLQEVLSIWYIMGHGTQIQQFLQPVSPKFHQIGGCTLVPGTEAAPYRLTSKVLVGVRPIGLMMLSQQRVIEFSKDS